MLDLIEQMQAVPALFGNERSVFIGHAASLSLGQTMSILGADVVSLPCTNCREFAIRRGKEANYYGRFSPPPVSRRHSHQYLLHLRTRLYRNLPDLFSPAISGDALAN